MTLTVVENAIKILFVIFFFGLCIFLHELGHLLVALWRHLYVQRFSLGFGKKLWGKTINGVEYVVSALPFGGYVALPQLDPTDEPKSADGIELPHASPMSRILTAAAGPLANVLFGFFLALFVWKIGIHKPAPAEYCDVMSVPETCAEYRAGLRPGDRIVAVKGKGFSRGWDDMSRMITLSSGPVMLSVNRDGEMVEVTYTPEPNPDTEGLGYPFFRVHVPIVVHGVVRKSPAEAVGLQRGDRVLKVNGKPLCDTDDFVDMVRQSKGETLTLTIDRGGRELTVEGFRARLERVGGEDVYRIGVHFGAYVLTHPNPWEQFISIFTQTRDTLRSLFAKGSLVKPKHMSGPVGILQIIWMKVTTGGFIEGLSFVILITFSLAFFNLLPIPVLDGGHIVFALLEVLIRRRIPTRLAHAVQTAFAVLLIAFMLYVTVYDIKRSFRIWRLWHPAEAEGVAEPAEAEPVGGEAAAPGP